VDRTATQDIAVALNLAANRFGNVLWSNIFDVHDDLPSERDETGRVRCVFRIEVGVRV
jgi:hypothetical protein